MNADLFHRWRTKYGAKATVVDGYRFHSQREATRYGELKLLEKAGRIWELELQPSFELRAHIDNWQTAVRLSSNVVGEYRADFRYKDRSGDVIEEVKGYDYPLGRWKRKHCEIQYGVTVRVVK